MLLNAFILIIAMDFVISGQPRYNAVVSSINENAVTLN
jgi:hypothetical protein